jgi:hypothetical protein
MQPDFADPQGDQGSHREVGPPAQHLDQQNVLPEPSAHHQIVPRAGRTLAHPPTRRGAGVTTEEDNSPRWIQDFQHIDSHVTP